ncbi:DUF2059 domain-containing protein [Undibacterium sp. Ji83W]|uniref:DUF2059 domain-containing protein n=1 Tax=Undibacterium sp. Ji83W TaxID=3413043 RepID=UPI003BF10A01
MRHITALIAITLVCLSEIVVAAESKIESATESLFAESALIGMQLSVRHGYQLGKTNEQVVNCANALKKDEFIPVFHALFEQEFNAEERKEAEAFYSSAVGRKSAKYALLQIYVVVGVTPPEPMPRFDDADIKRNDQFVATNAGKKLIYDKVLETPSSKKLITGRIQQLIKQCQAL